MVILLHVSAQNWGLTGYNSYEWRVMDVYDSLSRSCVPIFFMISGAVFLKRKMDVKKLHKKYTLRLFMVFLIWNTIYALDSLISSDFNISFYKVFTDSKYHLWFLPYLIGIYLILPLLYSIVNYEDGKYLEYYLIIFILCGVLKSTLAVMPGVNRYFLDLFKVELCEFAGYFVLGYYLTYKSKIKMKNTHIAILFVFTSASAIIINQLNAYRTQAVSSMFYGSFTIPVFIEAVLIFMYFQNMHSKIVAVVESSKLSKYIYAISKSTLCIYLLHPFILEHLYSDLHITSLSINPIAAIPLLSIAVFIVCIWISLLLEYIIAKVKDTVRKPSISAELTA